MRSAPKQALKAKDEVSTTRYGRRYAPSSLRGSVFWVSRVRRFLGSVRASWCCTVQAGVHLQMFQHFVLIYNKGNIHRLYVLQQKKLSPSIP